MFLDPWHQKNQDAIFVTSAIQIWDLPSKIEINVNKYKKLKAFRTHENGLVQYKEIRIFDFIDGSIIYDAPTGTITTFIGME